MIARDEPYLLFVDELNVPSFEVQKAFYSLINDRRLGEYRLPDGSVVVGAGNSATLLPQSGSRSTAQRSVWSGFWSEEDTCDGSLCGYA